MGIRMINDTENHEDILYHGTIYPFAMEGESDENADCYLEQYRDGRRYLHVRGIFTESQWRHFLAPLQKR